VVGILSGIGSAALLASLEWATDWRESHLWIIAFLPLGGFLSGWIYHRLVVAVVGDRITLMLGLHHTAYRHAPVVPTVTVLALEVARTVEEKTEKYY